MLLPPMPKKADIKPVASPMMIAPIDILIFCVVVYNLILDEYERISNNGEERFCASEKAMKSY